ncbi:single-stranded-DNA-specific exonuclease RecJ [Hansschlegelia quercus]|uniref:Single-stranded-DNA-specific exonuclease RecJ n=1 Tax=Hansschlegelia quercus TaxID=2528245 RepID=A0A4Q9GQA2_9HYPH|nr:single-stranded-DNA-specific exonuclease RecJ [Hansschlegelia quercus]TBN54170.1 single-stranded-DNA-specific exonuclease RecJ [Hansschlegelia quercus]
MTAAFALARPTAEAFLGVESSFSGRVWRDRLDLKGRAAAAEIVRDHGLADLLARALAGRGVTSADAAAFLEPSVRSLMPDPSTLTAMDAAAGRLADAIERAEHVAVFGDYDVDGATSAALLAGFLREAGAEARVHIPDRIFEGYGPNTGAIDGLADGGATLLVTVDCGSTSFEPLAHARARGLDVVVLDHHQVGEALPEVTALVNPNRQDDLSGLGHLAACGVTFMTLVATARELRRRGFWAARGREPDLLSHLDLVALGTVADVVPLVGLNRAFVAKGLIAMRRRERLGLRALMDASRLDGPPAPYHLGFLLGPRINAGGRIGDAGLGCRLMLSTDETEALSIAAELDRLNGERQAVERATLDEAEAEASLSVGPQGEGAATLVVSGEGWHPGVVGLVAARLKEKFRRPAFAIAFNPDGVGTGSGRSIQGVDLGAAVRAAVEEGIAVKGGGHAMAAGITLRAERLGAFRAFLDERLGASVARARGERALHVDAALSAAGATTDLVRDLERAGPFGSAAPEPVLALAGHSVASADVVGQGHVRLRLKAGDGASVNAIAFRAAESDLGASLLGARGNRIHAAGTLTIDRWGGSERISFRLIDAARAET